MSNAPDIDSYKSTFGARIDTLVAGLQSFEDGDETSEFTIRRIAYTVGAPAGAYQLSSLWNASLQVRNASPAELPAATRALIQVLRESASDTPMRKANILVVGANPELLSGLRDRLTAPSREVVLADNAEIAQKRLQEAPVSCIILNVILPDQDSRTFFTSLRENALTASIPVLFVGTRIDDQMKELSQLHQADGYAEHPQCPDAIAAWIHARLRRSPEPLRAARRDVLTGLLNQAAARESFDAIQKERATTDEPLSLACIAVDSARHVLNAFTEEIREEILQDIGRILSSSLRASDTVARVGVYEFLVMLQGEDVFGGTRAMENILEAFKRQCISPSNPAPHDLSVSIGVMDVPRDKEFDNAISDAEHLVYMATSMGGNCVFSARTQLHYTRTHRILILSADKLTCDILSKILEKEGFSTTCFSNLEEALSGDLGEQKFHLVIIDQDFPPSGGFAVLDQLRKDPNNNRLSIVMLISGHAEDNVAQALDRGANDYLIRPFAPLHLVQRIRRLLSRRPSDTNSNEAVRALIFGSNTKNMILAATILHQRGFKIFLSVDVEDACSRYHEIVPKILILDVSDSPQAAHDFAQELAKTASDMNRLVGVLIQNPDQRGEHPSLYPIQVMGRIETPLDTTKFPEQLESMLRLPAPATRVDASHEHLNREIQRVMPAGN